MGKRDGYIFVLWADQFEEDVATIFVTVLRQAGLRVKVVGLTPRRLRGAHGLALVPDFTLDQALPLADQARGVIIPGPAARLQRGLTDPRLGDFLAQARANEARFVIGSGDAAAGEVVALPAEAVTIYPDKGELMAFARRLAGRL